MLSSARTARRVGVTRPLSPGGHLHSCFQGGGGLARFSTTTTARDGDGHRPTRKLRGAVHRVRSSAWLGSPYLSLLGAYGQQMCADTDNGCFPLQGARHAPQILRTMEIRGGEVVPVVGRVPMLPLFQVGRHDSPEIGVCKEVPRKSIQR